MSPTQNAIESQAQAEYAELCGTIHTPAIAAALERARVVGVLDAWEESDERRGVEWSRSDITHRITLTGPGLRKGFSGVSRDAARAAAAKAIEAGEVTP